MTRSAGSRGCPTAWPSTSAPARARPRSTTGPSILPCASSTSTPSGAWMLVLIQMPDFFDVVQRQRAYRSFAPGDVPDDLVNQVLDAATFAPSAENKQPWVFVVVKAAATRKKVADLTRRAWEGGARDYEQGRLHPKLLDDVDHGATKGISQAPVIVVV